MLEAQDLRGQLPDGVQDLLPAEATQRRQTETTLRQLFSTWAYQEIIPTTIEYSESLSVGAHPSLRQSMYQFFDRQGRALALRTDFTTQIARLAAGNLTGRPLPLRCFYVGSVFRYEENPTGGRREFTQAGVELIGSSSSAADAEVVALAAEALQALGCPDFILSLGQAGILRALTASLPAAASESIRRALDRRSPSALQDALDEAGLVGAQRDLLARLPDLAGGPEVLEAIHPLGGAAAEAAGQLGQVYQQLQDHGIGQRVLLDLGEARGMDYYTGITFRGLVPGLGRPVLGGGRYDQLVGRFGRDLPAVGFGLELEPLAQAQASSAGAPKPDLLMGPCSDPASLALARQLRQRGWRVEQALEPMEEAALLDYSRLRGSPRALCRRDPDRWLLVQDGQQRLVSTKELLQEATI